MTRPTNRHECDRDCGRAPGSCSDCPYIVKPSRILRNVAASMKLLREFDIANHRHDLMLDDAPVGTETGTSISFSTHWSEEDQEWVGTCSRYPSLSHLAPTEAAAMNGILRLAADEETGA